jgi:hypothetical protein
LSDASQIYEFIIMASDVTGNTAFTEAASFEVSSRAVLSTLTRTGTNITLTWKGGLGPFQVQRRSDLTSGDWINVGDPVSTHNATVSGQTDPVGFYRVVEP